MIAACYISKTLLRHKYERTHENAQLAHETSPVTLNKQHRVNYYLTLKTNSIL